MTKIERFALFQRALAAMTMLEERYPGYPAFLSIHNQLLYLVDLMTGRNVDLGALSAINLGFITMREVESRDEQTAEILYLVSAEVKAIKLELNLPA